MDAARALVLIACQISYCGNSVQGIGYLEVLSVAIILLAFARSSSIAVLLLELHIPVPLLPVFFYLLHTKPTILCEFCPSFLASTL